MTKAPNAPSYKIPDAACPYCQKPQNRTAVTDARNTSREPKGGDPCLCIRCAAINVFNDDLTLRMPTSAERRMFENDPDIREAQRRIRKVHDYLSGLH